MKEKGKTYIGIIIGALLIAIGLYFFWAPSNLAAGGVSGLAIVIKVLLPYIPIGIIIFALDIIMFAIGFIFLGKSFGIRSLVCSISVSTITTILELIYPNWQPISGDNLLILIFGSLIISLGQAIVFNLEASSGGTDIIAKIISRYTHLNIGTSLLIADLSVVLFATSILGLEKGLYAALGVIVTTQLIDYFISGFGIRRYITIMPSTIEKANIINQYIIEELKRSSTVYFAAGIRENEMKQIITVIIERKEFVTLKNYVMNLDQEAIITVQNLHEVVGDL